MKAFIDTNIFVYATYSSFDQHQACRDFLRDCLNGTSQYYVSWSVVYEYLRVVTHPQIFPKNTLSLKLAIENVTNFCLSSKVQLLTESEEHFSSLLELANSTTLPIRGNLVHDAHAVTLMIENGINIIYTTDSDYNRFKGIKVKSPLL